MSRLTRILAQVVGSIALFALFAVAGWAITDWLASDDKAGEDTIAMLEYPLVPEGDEAEPTLEWIAEQQAMTAGAMANSDDPEAVLGDPAAGGQSARVTPASSLSERATGDPDGAAPTTTMGGGGDESAEGVPRDVFADAPYLRGRLDLTEVVIADPVGPLQIDICAGSEVLPATPAGCPPGYGGTIVPLDGELPSGDPFVGGRPPTGLTAFGTDVLYVRAFRRSSVQERIWLSATEPGATQTPTDVCDTGGVVPERTGIGSDRRPTSTIPIDTSGGASTWPYDPAFDTMDIYRLVLSEGTQYAICVYWIDDTGPQAVSYWQAMPVTTASANRMKVSVSGYDTADLPLTQDGGIRLPAEPPLAIAVHADCYGSGRRLSFDWPGSGRFMRLDPVRTLCDFESMTDVLQNGGIPLSVSVMADDGPNVTRDEWISIDRSDILCRSDCTERFVVGFALPDIEYQADDAGGGPFSVDRSAIRPSVYRAGRLSLLVEFDVSGSTASQAWFLGDPQSFDTSDRITDPPPTLTLVTETTTSGEMEPYELGEHIYATVRSFRVENAEPVSIEVEVLDFEFDVGKETCAPSGHVVPSYRSDAPSSVHSFQIDSLCLGDDYWLRIVAVDAAGVEYDINNRSSTGDRANLFYFSTGLWSDESRPGYTYDLVAELQLGALPMIDRAFSPGPYPTWVYMIGDLDVRDGPWGGTANPPDDVSTFATGWKYSNEGRYRLCNETPYERSQPPPLPFVVRGVEARELGNPIVQTMHVKLHEWPVGYCWGSAPPSIPSFDTDLSLSADLTLTQLVEGVVITDGVANFPRLVVRATNVVFTGG